MGKRKWDLDKTDVEASTDGVSRLPPFLVLCVRQKRVRPLGLLFVCLFTCRAPSVYSPIYHHRGGWVSISFTSGSGWKGEPSSLLWFRSTCTISGLLCTALYPISDFFLIST